MGTLKKLFGAALVTGAAVGGALYLKKRKDEREKGICFDDSETLKDKKMVEILKEDEKGTISVTINTKKIKATTDKAADKVLDATAIAKESITETIGEDNIKAAKETFEIVKDTSVEVVNTAKDFVVDTIGEENIEMAKDKVKDMVDTAKTVVTDTVNKYTNNSTNDIVDEDDFLDDELEEF